MLLNKQDVCDSDVVLPAFWIATVFLLFFLSSFVNGRYCDTAWHLPLVPEFTAQRLFFM
jgi:hypothetical protein